MPTRVRVNSSPTQEEKEKVRRYNIQYSITAYTFPTDARIHRAWFNDEYLHVELMDGRVLSVPLSWIPTLYNAAPDRREKFEISRDRRWLIWDPDVSGINEEIRISDYLGPVEANKRET